MFKLNLSGRWLTVGLVVAAASLPAEAQARVDYEPAASTSAPAQVVAAPQAHQARASAAGFQWGDAGIGAGGMVLVLGAGAGASGVLRRRRVHRVVTG